MTPPSSYDDDTSPFEWLSCAHISHGSSPSRRKSRIISRPLRGRIELIGAAGLIPKSLMQNRYLRCVNPIDLNGEGNEMGGAKMQKRKLGRTGLEVSVLGYGAGAVGGLFTKGTAADQERAAARAIEAGVNYFDTAAL